MIPGKGNLHPKKRMRESASTVMEWRRMTRQQQDAHNTCAKAAADRAARVRNREGKSDANAARAMRPRTVSPTPDSEESEAPEEPPSL